MFEISDKYVDIPDARRRFARPCPYPFAKMAVRQHFDAPCDLGRSKNGTDRRQSNIGSAAYSYAKNNNAKFVTRLTVDEDGKKIVRCWRVK